MNIAALPASTPPLRKRYRWRGWILAIGLMLATIAAGGYWLRLRGPTPATEIYAGVVYGCDRLPTSSDGSGLVHWARIDLSAPGIELYVTPLDPNAIQAGWQYRLKFVSSAVREQQLAVAINGTLFTSDSGWLPLPGDFARAVETTVADHHVNEVSEHTYLLWFGDDLTPHQDFTKPPTPEALREARWGIGGEGVGLRGGVVRGGDGHDKVDSRTAIGIDSTKKLLFLATFERASPQRALEKLAELGAIDGMLLDGGDSSSMVLGSQCRGMRGGTVLGGWRPVATHFGVRANPF